MTDVSGVVYLHNEGLGDDVIVKTYLLTDQSPTGPDFYTKKAEELGVKAETLEIVGSSVETYENEYDKRHKEYLDKINDDPIQ